MIRRQGGAIEPRPPPNRWDEVGERTGSEPGAPRLRRPPMTGSSLVGDEDHAAMTEAQATEVVAVALESGRAPDAVGGELRHVPRSAGATSMSDPGRPIRPVLVGNRLHPRYAIASSSSPVTPRLYWTGTGDDPWTADPSVAMKWADFGAVEVAIRGMGSGESGDSPGA